MRAASAPSAAAIEAAFRSLIEDYSGWCRDDEPSRESAQYALEDAHDPMLGMDRSVRLRDVVDAIRNAHDHQHRDAMADYIALEFGGES